MDTAALEQYLHRHIPVSRAMGISVVAAARDGVELRAALAPNLNHRSTAFGGSVASLGVLAGWSLLRLGLDGLAAVPQIVIQRSTIEYMTPIAADFHACCRRPSEERWDRFMNALVRRGRGRLELDIEVRCDDALAARLHCGFVALR